MKTDTIIKLVDILFTTCLNEGGDGDSLWYSSYINVKEIYPYVEDYNSKLNFHFEIELIEDTIYCVNNQESVIITNNKDFYKQAPAFTSFLLNY